MLNKAQELLMSFYGMGDARRPQPEFVGIDDITGEPLYRTPTPQQKAPHALRGTLPRIRKGRIGQRRLLRA